MTKAKLHDVPARILSIEGKAIHNPRVPNRSPDIVPKPPPAVSKKAKPGKWKKRQRQPGEVVSVAATSQNWNKSLYKSGDGETGITRRIGADDHLQWQSHGDPT